MEFVYKVTVITPESFNEFYSEKPDSVLITDDGYLSVTETQQGVAVRVKVFAPGQWSTVETELMVAEDSEESEGEEVDGFGF